MPFKRGMSYSDPATWHPQESPADLWNERSYFAGILIGAVAYGVHATLFFITMQLLWARKRTHWRDYTWIGFVLVLFTLSSIGNGTQLKFTEMIFIDNRAYPGGPSAYLVEQQDATAAIWCVGSYLVNNWMQDGLILYRFWIIYGRRWTIALFPALLFIGGVGTTIALFVTLNRQSFYENLGAQLLLAYYAMSVGLNVILTVGIVGKLWITRRRLRAVTSTTSLGPHYSVAAMLVESAFLYSACGIAFLIPWGLGDPFQNLILPTLAQVESIAPLLIIMRVTKGQAWSAETGTRVTNTSLVLKRSGQGTSAYEQDVENGLGDTVALSTLRTNGKGNDSTIKVTGNASSTDFTDSGKVFSPHKP